GQVDRPLLRADPAQLLLAGDRAPETAHVRGDRVQRPSHDDWREGVDGGHHDLRAPAQREGEPVTLEPVAGVGLEHNVGGGVVGLRVHGIGACERPRGGESHVVRREADDLVHRQPLTAPTRRTRAIYRSRAIAIEITGPSMIRMSTDMYHHCGPRVAFCAATVRGSVWAFALVRKRAMRYSFHAKTRTKRNVATSPGTARGSTIERKMR